MKRTRGKKDRDIAVRSNSDTERKCSKDAETKRISWDSNVSLKWSATSLTTLLPKGKPTCTEPATLATASLQACIPTAKAKHTLSHRSKPSPNKFPSTKLVPPPSPQPNSKPMARTVLQSSPQEAAAAISCDVHKHFFIKKYRIITVVRLRCWLWLDWDPIALRSLLVLCRSFWFRCWPSLLWSLEVWSCRGKNWCSSGRWPGQLLPRRSLRWELQRQLRSTCRSHSRSGWAKWQCRCHY